MQLHIVVSGNLECMKSTQFGQPFQSAPQVVQVPLTTAIPVPSLHSPIPDSLNTLLEFITRMERVLAQNGDDCKTPEALSIVLRRAEQLLSGPTTAALSHIAGRLEQLVSSTDPAIRGHIQSESMQVGLAMQHLGSLLLELGRTILTLNMGQSPAESSVNAGPAVYIFPIRA
ncbi:hypothetical protein NC651_014543 [Populus alba x Populus x berolinensis]|nr:hypothetical protein NC651_014543 [Populus alba x Populus x berolinensis]